MNVFEPIMEADSVLIIIKVKIIDREKFMEYVVGHLPSIEQYGGKIIFEGAERHSYESPEEDYHLCVIQKWDSKAVFDTWWDSEEYKPWKEMRHLGAEVKLELIKQRAMNH